MMEGITLLSTIEEGIYTFQWGPVPTILLSLGILATIFFLFVSKDEDGISASLALWFVLIFFILGFGQTQVGTYNVYKVTIDETVSMQKFLDEYEIIKQDGLIYEIKDRVE